MSHWEDQPRDERGRFAETGSMARQLIHPGTSSFAPLRAIDNVLDNPYVLNAAKIGVGVGAVALATRTGNFQPAVGALTSKGFTTATHSSATKIYFKTPMLKSATWGTQKNNVQVAGQAFGYRRTLDDKITGAVQGSAAGLFNNNPWSKSFQFGKKPYQTWKI